MRTRDTRSASSLSKPRMKPRRMKGGGHARKDFLLRFWSPRALVVVGLFQFSLLGYLHSLVSRPHNEKSDLFHIQTAALDKNHPPPLLLNDTSTPSVELRNVSRHFFNSWNRARYVCGHKIPPQANITLLHCLDPTPRLHLTSPKTDGSNMPPTVVHLKSNYTGKQLLEKRNCSVPCQVAPLDLQTNRNPVVIDDTPFKFVVRTMEAVGYHPKSHVITTDYQLNRFYATPSFRSDIPMPYYSPQDFNIQAPAIDFDKAIKGASFLAMNCESLNNREEIVSTLIDGGLIRVDSLSECLHNADPPNGANLRNKTEVQQHYLFHLAFENQKEPDYITEKLWSTLESGTLPVYFGASNIDEHAPPNSIIVVDDFATMDELARYLAKVADNRTLYESYHSWRKHPLPEWFHHKYEFSEAHSDCRVCKWGYAHKYGLGWDPVTQSVRDTLLPRTTCVDDQGCLSGPVREHWFTSSGAAIDYRKAASSTAGGSCDFQERVGSTLHFPGSWSRTVWEHDGVTDLIIKGKGQVDLMLKLEATLLTDATELMPPGRRARSQQHYWIQNQQSRITIFTSELTNPSTENKGTVAIAITEPIRIRILVEDVDTFHEGAEQFESYFSTIMADDFFHPVEESLVPQ